MRRREVCGHVVEKDDGDEWYGTIVEPGKGTTEGALSAKLPTYHIFAAKGVADTGIDSSSDLSDWKKNKLEVTATFVPGEEDEAGKVTITPVGSPDKAFMRVVIPKDPGAE